MNENVTPDTDLLYEVRDGIGRIIFNRPQARNSLTFGMYERLAAICEAAADDRSLKVLILSGAGDKAFAAGTDQPVSRLQHSAGRHRLRAQD